MHDTNDIRKSKELHDKEKLIDIDKILKEAHDREMLIDEFMQWVRKEKAREAHDKDMLIDELERRVQRLEERVNMIEFYRRREA